MISPGRGAAACSPVAEQPQGLLAVGDDVEAVVPAGLGEGLADYEGVAGVVFDQQHVDGAGPGYATSSSSSPDSACLYRETMVSRREAVGCWFR